MQTTMEKKLEREQVLRLAKLQWEQYRQQYLTSLGILNDAVLAATEAGMSQSEVGRILDWPRQRVSKLLADLAADTQG
jgi:hypothetical protein